MRLEEGPGRDGPSRPPELFGAIRRRHTNHREYDGAPVPNEVQTSLESVATDEEIQIHFTDDPDVRRRVDDLTVRADALQFADSEWRDELGDWLGRGVFGTGWLVSKIAQFAVRHLDMSERTQRKDSDLLGSASLLGLVAASGSSVKARLQAGQVFERLFLAATNAGYVLQPMNQILQVEEVRDDFVALLPEEWAPPQITFRLGRAEAESHTPRRPLEEGLR